MSDNSEKGSLQFHKKNYLMGFKKLFIYFVFPLFVFILFFFVSYKEQQQIPIVEVSIKGYLM